MRGDEYQICYNKDACVLQTIVNEHIEARFEPVGGLAIKYGTSLGDICFYQAMIRRANANVENFTAANMA